MENKFSDPDFDKLAAIQTSARARREFAPDEPPLPLRRELPDPAPFPTAALGDLLTPVAQRLRKVVQAPEALCAQSVLAAANLATQAHADVEIDGRRSPLSEFFVTIGETGERKSALDKIANQSARAYEEQLQRSYEAKFSFYRDEAEIYKRMRDEVLRGGKEKGKKLNQEDIVAALHELGTEPPAPIQPIVMTEDPTHEGLFKLFAIGQPSMGLFSDEGGRLVGGYGMSAEQQTKTAAGLSQFWDGKRNLSRVRAGDGASLMFNKRLSMHIMLQPIVAHQLLGSEVLAGQGLLSRCLFTFPASTIGTRIYQPVDLSQDTAIQKYNEILLQIFQKKPRMLQEKNNELDPLILSPNEEAKKAWVEFYNEIENQLGEGKRYAQVKGLGSKIPEHALRLAGSLALVENLHTQAISASAMENGIALARYYLEEALRITHQSTENPDLLLAEKLLTWLQQKNADAFYLAQIYQFGPNSIRSAEKAKKVIGILEDHGWISRIQSREMDGSVRKEVWALRKFN